jgi:DNA invertase Pin-like site-specific DNA recombinase
MKKIGYARVSTDEQSLALQQIALEQAGCAHIFADEGVRGCVSRREGLDSALAALRPGDAFLVWKLDRLGRSLAHLVDLMAGFQERRIAFISLTDGIDTATTGGRLVFHIMGALAEFERDLIAERTRAGMAAQKLRGRHVGRPRNLSRQQLLHAKQRLSRSGATPDSVAIGMGVSGNVLVRRIAEIG